MANLTAAPGNETDHTPKIQKLYQFFEESEKDINQILAYLKLVHKTRDQSSSYINDHCTNIMDNSIILKLYIESDKRNFR